MDYKANSTNLLVSSTTDKSDPEMLDEEGNIFPNPDSVIVYMQNIRNRKEQGSIAILK